MRIEQTGLGYSWIQQPQRQQAGQAVQFDPTAKAAQSVQAPQKTPSAEAVQGSAQSQGLSMTDPVRQPLSQYLSTEEKAMLGALFPATERSLGISAYAQGQNPGAFTAVRGQNIDLSS